MPVRGAAAALILPVPWLVSRVQESASQPERIPALMQIILFAALLLAAAWIDCRRHIIPDILNLGIALSAFLCFRPANLWGLLATVPFLVAAMGGGMGGGDVKMVAACGLVLGFWDTIFGSSRSLPRIIRSRESRLSRQNCSMPSWWWSTTIVSCQQ